LLHLIKDKNNELPVFIYSDTIEQDISESLKTLGVDALITEKSLNKELGIIIKPLLKKRQLIKKRNRSDSETIYQVRSSQKKLISYGCNPVCNNIDIANKPLHDAGGDLAMCRHFNLAGREGFVVADVAGHDVTSSYVSATFLGLLSSTIGNCETPRLPNLC
jgi:hypothetical protein